jgi:hypothetical protein
MLILKFNLILFKSLIEMKLNKDVLELHPKNLTNTSLMLEDSFTDYLNLVMAKCYC